MRLRATLCSGEQGRQKCLDPKGRGSCEDANVSTRPQRHVKRLPSTHETYFSIMGAGSLSQADPVVAV